MKKNLLMIAAMCVCSGAYAGNWYVGFGAGAARSLDAGDNIAAGRTGLNEYGITNFTNSDRTASVLSLLGGYRFNRFLGLEADYTDFGVFSVRGFAGPNHTLPVGRERNGISLLSMNAVVTAPMGSWFGVYAKAGAALANVDRTVCVSGLIFCDSSSDTGGATRGAVGVRFSPPSLIGEIRLDYSRYMDVDAATNQFTGGDFDVWQVQYVYDFDD